MLPRPMLPVLLCVLLCAAAPDVARGQATQVSTAVGVAVAIPDVVASGTPIERIQTGYQGLDDPIGIADGSLLFSDPGARRIHRLDPRTNEVSVLVAESNESHGVIEDSSGRLVSAQAWDGSTRIGVIYPPDRVEVLADSYDGQPFSRPNDLIVAKNGGVYFTDPGLTTGRRTG
jgi:gluconolactonase